MLEKAKMAAQALKIQKELKRLTAEAEAGDGAVRVVAGVKIDQASFSMELREVYIDPAQMEDADRVAKWVQSAVNQVSKKIMQDVTEKMQALAGGMNLPGM